MKSNRGGKFIADKPLSQNPKSVYRRLRNLTDDAFREKNRLRSKRDYGKRAQQKIAKARETRLVKDEFLVGRVKFHLSKGRDVGTIAVIENKPVSKLLPIIEQLNKEAA